MLGLQWAAAGILRTLLRRASEDFKINYLHPGQFAIIVNHMVNNLTSSSPNHKLVITREFAAPRELVWQAWTDPGQTKAWLGSGAGLTIEAVTMDLRVGGQFRIQQKRADGEFFTAAGTYLEVKPLERLVYTWDWEKDGGGTEFGEREGHESQVTVEFRARGKRTELMLTHEKLASVESRDRHEGGWTSWIGRLAKFVEAKQGKTTD
jgi:uncharacterized protein YndB with AHSA1/START domain